MSTEKLKKSNKVQAEGMPRVHAQHKTSKSILYMDACAHVLITIGGLATIAAVLLVFFFLVYVAWPLFAPSSATLERRLELSDPLIAESLAKPIAESQTAQKISQPSSVAVDEDRRLMYTVNDRGFLQLRDARTAELILQEYIFGDRKPTALMVSHIDHMIVAGFADGSIQIAHLSFVYQFLAHKDVSSEYQQMQSGDIQRRGAGVVFKTPSDQWRQTDLLIVCEDPLQITLDDEDKEDQAIRFIDLTMSSHGPVIATYNAAHTVSIHSVVEKLNMMTMTVSKTLESRTVPYRFHVESQNKKDDLYDLVLIGQGEYLLLLWKDGYSERYNALSEEIFLADKSRLADVNVNISSVGRFLGRSTVLIGYDDATVVAWFLSEPANAETKDGRVWQAGHRFPAPTTSDMIVENENENTCAVRSINSSARLRMALFTYTDDSARLVHVSSERVLYDGPRIAAGLCAAIAPRDDALIVYGQDAVNIIGIDAEHPDVTVASLFLPVWYESANGPETVWQSSSASDDAEAKLGLWPLMFGTLKATFYSLLFGVPIALAAAVYSSEFLSHKSRKVVKPCIEMMASLPSVVLGFLGGLILAVWLQEYIVDVLAAVFVLPLTVTATSYLIQLLPRERMRLAMRYRLWIIVAPCLILGCILTRGVAMVAEDILFAGDFIQWLGGDGSAFGGTWYICLPISIVLVMVAMNRWLKPALIERMRGRSLRACALVDGAKFICVSVVVVLTAALLALCIEAVGLEMRGAGKIFDVYETRNAMVVGFMMAFAIIPIVYTIADDALSAVPNHLRAASLGAGATPWQTAVRVIIPAAMSGLLSAVMVGLGRAIGETMIVLMAAGNTPIKDLNIFNGMKTLSANIASELPEAVMGSTHYRTLFLSALVLFIMTFMLNSGVEYIRARFRKQGASL